MVNMVDLSQASSLKESTNIMVSSTIKPHINAHSVCGRPTENVLENFMKGSLRGLYERSIYERTFLSEPIENHDISNALSKVKRVKKHLNKHYRVFRGDRELRFHHVDFLVFNPLRTNSDLSQTSHCNIKCLSVSELMRIENMITQVKFY